ncbi:MAG: hypothetical protein NTV01_08155, partial [Bacteroidia bacterium]|nr:hypothetical protein [Bacteroidia bacterium]
MKTIHSFIIRPCLIFGGIIALVIMLCAGRQAFAAHIAGTDENVNTTNAPAAPTAAIKQTIPSAQQVTDVKTDNAKRKRQKTKKGKASAQPAKKEAAKKYVTLDFDNVDISVLVKFISELTGKNFIIDDKVKGKVTIISPKKIPLEDVYKVFLSVLEVNGFTVVPSGNMTKIIPATSAREKGMETRLKNELASPEDRMVTQIVT